jgi:hypothetical protein
MGTGMEVIGGVAIGVTLIGGLIVILSFISERPKRQEVQDMIDRSIASIVTGIVELKDGQKEVVKTINELRDNIGDLCPYRNEHKG